MSLITTLEAAGASALSSIEHAAAWLVGTVAKTETSLHALESASPLVAEAIAIGEAAATAHGVPIIAAENLGGAVLQAAHDFVAGLTQPPAKAA